MYDMLNKQVVKEVELHHFKCKFKEFLNKKRSVTDFVLGLEKEIDKVECKNLIEEEI